MVFPSYWAREKKTGWKEGDAVYDHPIPIDEEGTLLRALRSLTILRNRDFTVLVLAVPTTEEIAEDVEKKVDGIVREASKEVEIPIKWFGPTHLKRLHDTIGEEEGVDLLQLRGYSNVRNLCIFLPLLMGSEIAILIDDDEVFEDPDFVDKAVEFVGRKDEKGNTIYAVAGYYLQPDGDFHVKKPFEPWMKYWDQLERMNEAFDRFIGAPPRLKETPFVFGGNMVLHREIIKKVPFDPLVPRGEDIDYLMNARMFGFKFFLDNTLSIKHLPPPKTHPVWRRLREDVFRFMFEREKIRKQRDLPGLTRIEAEDFDPYPGAFLKDDLEWKVEQASRVLEEIYEKEGDVEGAREARATVFLMRKALREGKRNPFEDLLNLQRKWSLLTERVIEGSFRVDVSDMGGGV